jgi:hypothetical protein
MQLGVSQSQAHSFIYRIGRGAVGVLLKAGVPVRDPVTGDTVETPAEYADLTCVVGGFSAEDMAASGGGTIQATDRKVMVSGSDLESAGVLPEDDDRFRLPGGEEVEIKNVYLLRPDPEGPVVYARLAVRT